MADLSHVLSEYDFILVGDRSGSMATEDMPGGRTRWNYMQESFVSFARDICKIDADGIGLVFFGAQVEAHDGVDAKKVEERFNSTSPRGSTPLAEALTAALAMAGKSAKKDFICVYTDGAPDDPEAVKRVIRDAAAKQNSDEDLTILFVQVGTDPGAARFLQTLDDGLNAKFDIVDAKSQAEADKFGSAAELIAAAIAD